MASSTLRLCSIAGLVMLAGCATVYTGASASGLPDRDVGILSHPGGMLGGILIEQIDGQWRGMGFIDTYRLAPGKHTIGARVNTSAYGSDLEVCRIDVMAGGKYLISALLDEKAYRWAIWVTDQTTNRRVECEE